MRSELKDDRMYSFVAYIMLKLMLSLAYNWKQDCCVYWVTDFFMLILSVQKSSVRFTTSHLVGQKKRYLA